MHVSPLREGLRQELRDWNSQGGSSSHCASSGAPHRRFEPSAVIIPG